MPAKAIRILMVAMPPLLAAVVRQALEAQADMTIVQEVLNMGEAKDAVVAAPIDCVIAAGDSETERAAYLSFLLLTPPVSVVAVCRDGSRIEMYGRRDVWNVSPEQLVAAIRDLVRADATSAEAGER